MLNWVAESYAGLGSGLADDKASADAAHDLFRQRGARPISRSSSNAESLGLTPDVRRHLQVRQAMAQRSAGQYEEAIQAFQQRAGRGRPQGGRAGRGGHDVSAVGGGAEAGAEVQEGHLRGGARSRDPEEHHLGLESHRPGDGALTRTIARSTIRPATTPPTATTSTRSHCAPQADREKYLKFAKDCIVLTYRLNPKMGGKEW